MFVSHSSCIQAYAWLPDPIDIQTDAIDLRR